MEGVGCLSVCLSVHLDKLWEDVQQTFTPSLLSLDNVQEEAMEGVGCLSVCPLRQAMGGRTANLRPDSPQFGQCTGRGHGRGRLSVCLST